VTIKSKKLQNRTYVYRNRIWWDILYKEHQK